MPLTTEMLLITKIDTKKLVSLLWATLQSPYNMQIMQVGLLSNLNQLQLQEQPRPTITPIRTERPRIPTHLHQEGIHHHLLVFMPFGPIHQETPLKRPRLFQQRGRVFLQPSQDTKVIIPLSHTLPPRTERQRRRQQQQSAPLGVHPKKVDIRSERTPKRPRKHLPRKGLRQVRRIVQQQLPH